MYQGCSLDSEGSAALTGEMEPFLLASSSSESSADESICALHLYNVATLAIIAGAIAKRRISLRKRGGSQPGKASNRDLGKRQAVIDINRDYFGRLGTSPVFSNSEFERRYRMPRCVYEEVSARVRDTDNYFQERSNALGMPGVSADVKITAALRQLSLGVSADGVVEYCRVSESTASESLKRFCAAVPVALGHECLRNPTAEELVRIEA
jgi:hypothetical protein